jgi:hypothetical protein
VDEQQTRTAQGSPNARGEVKTGQVWSANCDSHDTDPVKGRLIFTDVRHIFGRHPDEVNAIVPTSYRQVGGAVEENPHQGYFPRTRR